MVFDSEFQAMFAENGLDKRETLRGLGAELTEIVERFKYFVPAATGENGTGDSRAGGKGEFDFTLKSGHAAFVLRELEVTFDAAVGLFYMGTKRSDLCIIE